MNIKLVKQLSGRVDKKGEPYLDLYLCWTYENSPYVVRVRPQFTRDFRMLFALAEEVPPNELIEKYM